MTREWKHDSCKKGQREIQEEGSAQKDARLYISLISNRDLSGQCVSI